MNEKIIYEFIKRSLEEDLREGDITSDACIKNKEKGDAKLIAKENCNISGIGIAKNIYSFYDQNLVFQPNFQDGDKVKKNDVIFSISGNPKSILSTERLVLNCMQRMSGITTITRKFIDKVNDLNTIILDTRKTCPTIRFLEKYAVKLGGAENHRHGLYDMIMIKDNHIDFSGGISNAIKRCQKYYKKKIIIVEARNLKEVAEIISIGKINRILLDNFTISDTKKAVQMINKLYQVESSGNINIKNVRNYALCGVDYISIGALTHSIKSIDLSMVCR